LPFQVIAGVDLPLHDFRAKPIPLEHSQQEHEYHAAEISSQECRLVSWLENPHHAQFIPLLINFHSFHSWILLGFSRSNVWRKSKVRTIVNINFFFNIEKYNLYAQCAEFPIKILQTCESSLQD